MPQLHYSLANESHSVVSDSLRPHRLLQARIMEWVAFLFSRRSSQPRDRTLLLHCRRILYHLSHQGFFVTSTSTHIWKREVHLSLKYVMSVICVSRSVMSNSLGHHGLLPARFLCPWDFPGKNTGVGCHFLFQGIFPIQGSNPHLLHW